MPEATAEYQTERRDEFLVRRNGVKKRMRFWYFAEPFLNGPYACDSYADMSKSD